MVKMGYLHIDNLYKNTDILEFRKVYALEKIHGTSAHITWRIESDHPAHKELHLTFYAGGENHANFVKLFDEAALKAKFAEIGLEEVTIYGEAYGGKQQGMKETYGPSLRFVAFDVLIGTEERGVWLDVPKAEGFCSSLGIEFVEYKKVPAELEYLNKERDADSTQAIRNGVGAGKIREGIVIRPPFEVRLNNGKRLIAKHKRDEFKEMATPREVDPAKLAVLSSAKAIAEEWVVPMRLQHVMDKLNPPACDVADTKRVIEAMLEDITREAEGEIVWSPEVSKTIGKATAQLFKQKISKI